MANSLRAKISKLRHDGNISDVEYQELIKKLEELKIYKESNISIKNYEQGRADAIDECIENIIPTLYELDAEQEVIDCVQKWLEQLKEHKNDSM